MQNDDTNFLKAIKMLFSLSYLQVGQIPFVRGEDIPQIGTCIF
jgi:hypothetical protein